MVVQHLLRENRNGKETNSDAVEVGRAVTNGANAAIQAKIVSAFSLRLCVIRTCMWYLPTYYGTHQKITDEQYRNTVQEPSHPGMAIPSSNIDQIENGICPKNAHADR